MLTSMRFTHAHLAGSISSRVKMRVWSERRSALAGFSRRNNLDLSNSRYTYACTHTYRDLNARRKATRCEPDEPRTNGATNQWCDGPSLLLLTQRVYHTETDGRICSSLSSSP